MVIVGLDRSGLPLRRTGKGLHVVRLKDHDRQDRLRPS